MGTVANILWFLFGGAELAFLWFCVGMVCCLTIVCAPFGVQCFKFAAFIVFPFGRRITYSKHKVDFIWNALWILLAGWELALTAFVIGLAWCITIVGIPAGVQCLKFSKLALMPFGAKISKRRR